MSEVVEVVADAARARAMLEPTRLELLEALDEPSSAAALARRVGLPRQRVNYHLRALEKERLIEPVEETRRGSCIERTYRRVGQAFAISTATLGSLGTTPERVQDRFSSAYQIALASRAVREIGAMRAAARAAGQELPTLAAEVEVRFATPAARHAFATELLEAVAALVEKHHDAEAPDGRAFRFYVGGYPRPMDRGAAHEPD